MRGLTGLYSYPTIPDMMLRDIAARLEAAAKAGRIAKLRPETAVRIARLLRVAETMPTRDEIALVIDGRKAGETPSTEAIMKANAVQKLLEGESVADLNCGLPPELQGRPNRRRWPF
jgi:hypothetical protein